MTGRQAGFLSCILLVLFWRCTHATDRTYRPFSVDVKRYECIDYAPLRAHIDAAAQSWLVREAGRFRAVVEA